MQFCFLEIKRLELQVKLQLIIIKVHTMMLQPYQNFNHAIFCHIQNFVDPRDRNELWQSLTHAIQETMHTFSYPHYLGES